MKRILASVLFLSLTGIALADTDLTSVGSDSGELFTSYSYTRAQNPASWYSEHQLLTGLQGNASFSNDVGFSLSLAGGDTQTVTDYRTNFPTLAIGAALSKGFGSRSGSDPSAIELVGAVDYELSTGDRWLPIAHGTNSATPVDIVKVTGAVTAKVTDPIRAFVSLSQIYTSNTSEGVASNGKLAAVGAMVSFTKNWFGCLAYNRYWVYGNAQGFNATFGYTFN